MNSPPDWKDEFALLAQAYAQEVPNKLDQMSQLWSDFSQQGQTTSLTTLHRLAHNMAGAAATFGLKALSEQARCLDLYLKKMIEPAQPISPDQYAQVDILLGSLQSVASRHSSTAKPVLFQNTVGLGIAGFPAEPLKDPLDAKVIFVVDDDPIMAADLTLQIGYFGYKVRTFNTLASLEEAVRSTPPAAIILDIIFPEGHLAGIEAMANLLPSLNYHIPLIFTSARTDMVARLQAVRARGDAYFTKPIDIGVLIDKLDQLTSRRQDEPYRVLIVDDEPELAAFHASVLNQTGIQTMVVTDPLQLLQPLMEFRPDLLLIDLYMPECTGLELAAVIRQQESLVSIPIVFLSTETNQAKQMIAMRLGGDDFLTKPIPPDHLIVAITSRVLRYRSLRSLMIRDSLTGLLNHTRTKEHLDIEFSRAQRFDRPLSFAMLDIDLFKAVNDTHGHSTGDSVIKSLSRLLQQRLRKMDIIGRYGGEEFAVVLPETDGSTAMRLMDHIRSGFAQIRHFSNGKEFTVTFSCGIASYPTFDDPTRLTDAADAALYAAKAGGRNQTILASQPES